MTQKASCRNKNSTQDLCDDDVTIVRNFVLGNINDEVLNLSQLVESSIEDLTREFQTILHGTNKQAEDLATACDVIQRMSPVIKNVPVISNMGQKIVHDLLMENMSNCRTTQNSVIKVMYTLQFQDRFQQAMQALSVSLQALMSLSETGSMTRKGDDGHFYGNKKEILNRLVENAAQQGFDQSYIRKIFYGSIEETEEIEEMELF